MLKEGAQAMKKFLDQALSALEQRHVNFPYELLKTYNALGLSDIDMMVIIHILSYQQIDHAFPDLDRLAERMSLTADEIAVTIQRLIVEGHIQYVERMISIRPLLERMIGMHQEEEASLAIFTRFEQEFGRLLSPLEYEQITRWLNEDGYKEWLIIEALRESVLSGVFNFRYVDTILRGWARANIKSEKQLSEYRKTYRKRSEPEKERTAQRSPQTTKSTPRAVPAVQTGKYKRFYELFENREETSVARTDTTK
ncbi:hypothetical protein ATW55_08465 [Ferroacidibacillus organovorans]|uniref:Uncharacterized protein n=2 Tax=Ferroacidibacillus organovorans TaxID=1765683 RepID=A0A101XSN2_9BACL|nr:hypothetical protein ATW55_08465 [Ferroacidibacillus organovorans]